MTRSYIIWTRMKYYDGMIMDYGYFVLPMYNQSLYEIYDGWNRLIFEASSVIIDWGRCEWIMVPSADQQVLLL